MSKCKVQIVASLIAAGFLVFLASSSARADSVTLTLSAVSGGSGGTITIDGTITNGTSSTVYLNGEDFSFGSSAFLNGDITDFLLNAPLSLAADSNSGVIPLFTFEIASGTAVGVYTGNFLDIIGGTDPSDFTDVLASSPFSVNVTATPEPTTFIFLVTGLLALVILRRRRLATIRP